MSERWRNDDVLEPVVFSCEALFWGRGGPEKITTIRNLLSKIHMDYSYNLEVIRTNWLKNNKIICLVSEPDVCIQINLKKQIFKTIHMPK